MKKDLNVRKIGAKFQEIIGMQTNEQAGHKLQEAQKKAIVGSIFSIASSKTDKISHHPNLQLEKQNPTNENAELIFTKSDICRQVAKLKPYLKRFGETQSSVQIQDRNNKRIGDEEQNSLSQLVIYLNKELCEQLRGIEEEEAQSMKRQCREKEGWVYEVFYRLANTEQPVGLNKTVFKNGYAVLTDMLELFPNLTFEQSLLRININQVKRVKYFEQKQYQVIDIRFKDGTLHVAFLSEAQMKLFDRMLFLLKNMARTSSTRLFQNQLLKNIYSQY